MNPHPRIIKIIIVFTAVFSLNTNGFSQISTSDKYAPVFPTEREQPSTAKKIANNILTYPFELVRWPMDKGIYWTDEYRVDTKTLWLYNKIQEKGVTPRLSFLSLSEFGAGADFDIVRILNKRGDYPDLKVKTSIDWTREVNFETSTEIGLERIHGTGFHISGLFKYDQRSREKFYGIGPDTSRGEGTSYKFENTTLGSRFGYSPNPEWNGNLKFLYQNTNITNGPAGSGNIDTTFPKDTISGLSGDDLITTGSELTHDTRNRKETSTEGGLEKVGVDFNEGLSGSDARYWKYKVEAVRYFKLRSEKRVFVARFYGEQSSEMAHHSVPFYDMAKLGGDGYYRLSQPLRGYTFNRFFGQGAALLNFEYRYTVWQHRDFKMDTVLLWDEGQVFKNVGHFKMNNFRASYGGGVRLRLQDTILFSIELAHSNEGTQVYAKTGTTF